MLLFCSPQIVKLRACSFCVANHSHAASNSRDFGRAIKGSTTFSRVLEFRSKFHRAAFRNIPGSMHLAANSSSSSSATQHAGRQASSHRSLALPRVQRHRSSPQQQPLLVRSTTTSSNSSNANSTQLPTLPVNSWIGAHNGAQSAADASKVAIYKRIMLKVSGEALQGSKGFGLDPSVVEAIALEIKAARQHGIQVAVVVGGGNYFRGASAWAGLERATADYVGMLATVMNALCLQAAVENLGLTSRVQTAIEMREVAEPYIRRRAISHLENGHVVIFGAGTGNPFFTTDTAAALRAAEIQAEVFLKATKVDGVYTCDPVKHPEKAQRYERLSYRQVTDEGLQVMDETAVTLCKENDIKIVIFDAMVPGNIMRAAMGEDVGTLVSHTC